jgi:hypothetical protein
MAKKVILGKCIKERKIMEKVIKPDIEGEMDEFQRISQDLRRDEKIDFSVEELVRSFDGLEEQTLTDDVWPKLENTESNEIEKGDIEAVNDIAKMYNKTSPKKLIKAIKSGDYNRPLILKMGERYILIAGNTRLCTAAAMGVNPKVFIGEIGEDIVEEVINNIKTDLNEKCWKGYTQKGMKTMFGKRYPNCVKKTKTKETKEQTDASSSGSYEGNAFGSMIKREIHKINNAKLTEEQEVEFKEATEASSSGAFDVPAFGKTTKGGRKNPLKIDGPGSEYKGRAVKDKNFPKWGGPDSVFVKVKDKCKKFPYCNQGNTGALEFIKEDQEIKNAITETSKKFGIPYKEMEKIVLNEITKIFI